METCPECEHRPTQSLPSPTWAAVKRAFGLKPPRAECNWALTSVESVDGMPGFCGCGSYWHEDHFVPAGRFGKSIIEGLDG